MTEKISPREVEQEIGKDPGYWQFLSDTDPGQEAAPADGNFPDPDEYDKLPKWSGHHPDCQCNQCYYGADAAKWLFNPSEY